MGTKNNRFNFHPDVFSVEDKLGFRQYTKTLGRMITSPDFKTPFCIGVYGDWGSGKTSFMRQLAKWICEPEKEESGKSLVIPVWFNPWRYEKEEHLIIPFLKTIAQETENYLKELEKKGEKENSKGIVESIKNFIKGTRRMADAVIYATKFTIKPSFLGFSLGEVEFDTSKGQDRDDALRQKQMEADKTLAEELTSLYYDAVRSLEETVRGKDFRIAVFIDDLDRCLPGKAIELLEAVKLFLDLEGYIFVIGVDKEVVERGIAWHYRHLDHHGAHDGESKEKKHAVIKSKDYLDKMIQFPLELPPVEYERRKEYIKSLLAGNEAYEGLADLIQKGVGDNPRALKRFVNLLAFMSWHADTVRQDILDDPKEKADLKKLVEENFVPEIYVKWSMIVFKFPDEYGKVKARRRHLIDMQKVARGEAIDEEKEKVGNLPFQLREILQEGTPFPEADYFLEKIVHLVQAAKVEEVSLKAEFRSIGEIRYKPGDMVTIHAGSFYYGEDKEEITLDYDYEMDVFPVTNKEYCRFLNEKNPSEDVLGEWMDIGENESRIKKDGEEYFVEKGFERHPVVYVSWHGAEAYAQWAGKRLPTEEEWEKAARGNDGREFPWGNDFDERKCNTEESRINGTSEVDKYPMGVSPYGCFDMAGNVLEWTDSLYDKDKDEKVIRGGCWDDRWYYARCTDRFERDPGDRLGGIGFRCAMTFTL